MKYLISRWIAASIFSFASTLALADPLHINLEKGTADGTVTVELTNVSDETVTVLRWGTPFETTLSDHVFQINTSAKVLPYVDGVPYSGRDVKRSTPTVNNFFTLAPRESRTASVDLTDYYDIPQIDLYTVRFTGKFSYVAVKNQKHVYSSKEPVSTNSYILAELARQTLISNKVSVALSPQLSVASRIRPPAYNGCSAIQQNLIESATQSAELLTNTALADLQSITPEQQVDSPRYFTWFGTYSVERYNTVVGNFQAISGALANESIRYDCTCNEAGIFAYVFPLRPYNIYLCPTFYTAEEIGTDSRAGTIIHELSHFTVLGGTDDLVYTQTLAQRLASSDPASAIGNADNYEYFAENTPNLSIFSDDTVPSVSGFTSLQSNTPITASINAGERDVFKSNGPASVSLISNSGDADLFVYTDGELAQQICSSLNVQTEDRCEISSDGILYIEVLGVTEANYTLEVSMQAGTDDENTNYTLTPLALDVPVSGTLLTSELFVYEITGARQVNMETVSGDPSLYIFSSIEVLEDFNICQSTELPENSSLDSCAVPTDQITYYAAVYGPEGSEYILTATTAVTAQPTSDSSIISFGELFGNQTVNQSIELQASHSYTSSGISIFELTSISGDADLLVYDGPLDENPELICISEEYSIDSIVDRCDVSSSTSNTFVILIFGHEASDYSLAGFSDAAGPVVNGPVIDNPAADGPVIDGPVIDGPVIDGPVIDEPVIDGPATDETVEDNPVIVVNEPVNDGEQDTIPVRSESTSGGGSIGMLGLLLGLAVVGVRQKYRLIGKT